MSGDARGSRRPAVSAVGALAAGAAILALVLGSVAPVAATASARVWVGRLGTAGTNGNVVVTLPQGAAGTVAVALKGLPAGTLVSGTIRRGTCAAPGSAVAALPGGRTTTAGRLAKKRAPTAREASAIASASSLVATIRAGAVRRCAALVERVAPTSSPSPTPTPTPMASPTPAATATASPAPTGSAVPVQVGQKSMVDGRFYLKVSSVEPYTFFDGATGILVAVQLEAFAPGPTVSSDQFVLVEPDGTLKLPVYCLDAVCPGTAPWTLEPWVVAMDGGVTYTRPLLFPAPPVGRLDLKYGSLVIRIRN